MCSPLENLLNSFPVVGAGLALLGDVVRSWMKWKDNVCLLCACLGNAYLAPMIFRCWVSLKVMISTYSHPAVTGWPGPWVPGKLTGTTNDPEMDVMQGCLQEACLSVPQWTAFQRGKCLMVWSSVGTSSVKPLAWELSQAELRDRGKELTPGP